MRQFLAVSAVSLLVVGATFIPYAYLDLNPPEGTEFSWISTHLPDEASYMMWASQHRDGTLFATNRMTTDNSAPIPPNLTWLVVGWTSRVTGMSLITAYHVARAVFAFGYLLTLWALLQRFLSTNRSRWLAFILVVFGSGFGWLNHAGLQIDSAEWITELWTFPSILHFPHFALSLWLLTATMLLWKDSGTRGSMPRAVGAGLALGALVLVHPYTAGTIGLVLGTRLFLGLRSNQKTLQQIPARYTLTTLMIASVLFAFQTWQLAENPTLGAWATQNRMPSPPPWSYLAGLGFVGILGFAETIRRFFSRSWTNESAILATWIVVTIILAYSGPLLPFERRCVEGVHIAIAIMAAGFVGRYLEQTSVGFAVIAIILAGLAVAPSTVIEVTSQCTFNNPGYVPVDQDSLYREVQSSVHDDGLFADPRTSLYLAAFGKSRVFAGHHELTPDFAAKIRLVERFFSTTTTWQQRLAILDSAKCRWVVTDPGIFGALLEPGIPSNVFVKSRGKSWVLLGVRQ